MIGIRYAYLNSISSMFSFNKKIESIKMYKMCIICDFDYITDLCQFYQHKKRLSFTQKFWILIVLNYLSLNSVLTSSSFDTEGPSFVIEPINRIDFVNNGGCILDCTARGNPLPNVQWIDQDNSPVTTISKLRHILANGSLYFPPFDVESFRQDIHWSVYRCTASNVVGSIVSRDILVKAVLNQRYEPEVQNPGAFIGSNVLIKCNIQTFAKEFVTVTSWLQEPNFNIYPSLEGDGKYHMLLTGELLLINVTRIDAQRTYRCRTHHKLTQEAVVSTKVGKIQLSEMSEPVPPIINEKVIEVHVRIDDPVVIPCIAYANPIPTYRWHMKRKNSEESIEKLISTGRAIVTHNTFIIFSVKKSDSGPYYCTATNSEGSETIEVKLSVSSPLAAHIQPARQTVDLGKSADLICTWTGFPMHSVSWLKDGQSLRTGSRVRLLTKEHIQITSISKEDKGLYQCFVKNDQDSAQGTAELKLGEIAPQLVYKFIEQTMQPGPSVSLKCSATGNPTPQITWNLDGFPLPNNDRLMIGQYGTMFGDVISHVNISAVKPEDGGEYECIAKSRAGESSHAARLNIYGMPYVRPMSAISAVAGKTLVLKCPVAGYPIESIVWEKVPPKITPFSFARDLNVGERTSIQCVIGIGDLPLMFTWLKDGQPLLPTSHPENVKSKNFIRESTSGIGRDVDVSIGVGNDGRITIRQNDDFTSALSITSVTIEQSGNYSCSVQNDAATATHSAQLRVNVPPRISPFNFEEDITEGMRTQLMCSSSQGDQPFNITWLKDDIPVLINSDMSDLSLNVNEYAPFSSILSIHNVTSSHNGNYTCQVTNRAGTVEYSALLSVAVPPRWLIEPQDESAILGTSVTISCKADGFPLPHVIWKQAIGGQSGEYRELNYVNGNSGVESHKNGTLIIHKVARENEGYFLCQASNGIGSGLSKLIKLTVHVGPHVKVRNKQVSVRRGDRVTLRCDADGDEPLEISWRVKGNRIDPTYDIRYHIKNHPITKGLGSELTLIQTTLLDRGEYSCVASNAYGHDHAALQLQVQEPPSFPINLHVLELSSRSVVLGWSPNDQSTRGSYRESQPISNYILQYKEAQDVWHEHNSQKLLQGEKTSASVTALKPANSYHFRLYAENHLGTSAPSDILFVQTEAEIPNEPPQMVAVEPISPEQLLIKWRAPEVSSWNGKLLGYTIGYRENDLKDAVYNYTKVGFPGGEGENDFRLIGLKKYTKYSVTISAFNNKGDGPASDPVIVHTLEDVPSASPQNVNCMSLTAQTIQVSWQSPPQQYAHGIIIGYKLLYEPNNVDNDYGLRETKITSALNTILHGLQPFTNYSVQILAYTKAGEGVVSPMLSCFTEEAVPDAPERIKYVVNSESSAIISWLQPRRPNGIITKYNVYIRVQNKGQDLKILKEVLPASNRHFEAKDLSIRDSYDAWVTASTRIGQGPSTPVIKLIPSSSIPAAIISFGKTMRVSWKMDLKLPCIFVGIPKPTADWKVLSSRSKKYHRSDVGNDNTLSLRNVQRIHEGNYSCSVRNSHGSDQIIYQVLVQVPPISPELSVTSSTTTSVLMQWKLDDVGGSPLRGFVLTYRKEFGEWEEIDIDRRTNSHLMENLQCGTRYQFTIAAINKIGRGSASPLNNVVTKGNKPIPPIKEHFVRPNITSVLLELSSWQDGGCSILYFTVEFRRYRDSTDWIVVSSSITAQARYTIRDLEAATGYNLRVGAHNHAGSTIIEYYFETLSLLGTNLNVNGADQQEAKSFINDSHFMAVIITSIFGTILAILGACICFKNFIEFNRSGGPNSSNSGRATLQGWGITGRTDQGINACADSTHGSAVCGETVHGGSVCSESAHGGVIYEETLYGRTCENGALHGRLWQDRPWRNRPRTP